MLKAAAPLCRPLVNLAGFSYGRWRLRLFRSSVAAAAFNIIIRKLADSRLGLRIEPFWVSLATYEFEIVYQAFAYQTSAF
jgi:hypothetical protein